MATKKAINNITKPVYDTVMVNVKALEDKTEKITYIHTDLLDEVSIDTNAFVDGNLSVDGEISTTDDLSVSGDLSVDGDTTLGIDDSTQVIVNGDLTANTIYQTNPNWEQSITTFPNITGGTATLTYGNIRIVNRTLQIVLQGEIKNETANTITAYSTDGVRIILPDDIASLIYDKTGLNVHEHDSGGNDYGITVNFAFVNKSKSNDVSTANNNARASLINVPIANQMEFSFKSGSAFTINAGETMYFDGRIWLAL